MADDQFHMGSGNWWDTSRNRYDGGTTPTSISTTLNAIASFGWPSEMVDMKPRSSMDPATPSSAASMVSGGGVHDHQSSAAAGVLDSPNLQLMGFGLSSHSMDWNQALLGEKADSSFRSLLQEDMSSTSGYQQESGPAGSSSQEHDFKQINRGFSLDQPQFSSQAISNDSSVTSQNLNKGFQVDSAAAYGFLLSENRPVNYPYPSGGYGANVAELIPSWNKYQQFLRTSPPPPPPAAATGGGHLHFTNNASFWDASATDARSSFFPAIQTHMNTAASSFDEKPKNPREVQDLSSTTKKNSIETSNKRPRNETPSPLPGFKVRKEKMGDRITALQQLVSPFGKTDTASVLSEAIEYIKFLHGQVSALTTPYMKNGAPTQHPHQDYDKSKNPDGPRHDLRSRGLCLVPVSSTFPMTHESTVDFWSPAFGGNFK